VPRALLDVEARIGELLDLLPRDQRRGSQKNEKGGGVMKRVSVQLEDEEYEQLHELAEKHRRTPGQHLGYVLKIHLLDLVNGQGWREAEISLELTVREADCIQMLLQGIQNLQEEAREITGVGIEQLAGKLFRQYHDSDGNVVRRRAELYRLERPRG
jgi:predicted transcriptional regulator